MKRTKFLNIAALLVVSCSTFLSCNKNDDNDINQSLNLPADIAALVNVQGNINSNDIIINTQGGPVTSFESETLGEFMQTAGTENAMIVNVHQVQTKNPELFNSTDITFNQAKEYDNTSVANLAKVVKYFKNQPNKKVYVLGISFGAFMTQELIATEGTAIADKFVIMVGRLDIETEFWEGFSRGENGGYTYDNNGNATIALEDLDDVLDRNMKRLAAGLGFNRYTQRLAGIDLSNVAYIHGDRDEQVGPMTQEEIDFLETNGAITTVVEGGQHSPTINQGLTLIKELFNID